MPSCRSKTGKFTKCRNAGKGSRKKRKDKESRSPSRTKTSKSPKYTKKRKQKESRSASKKKTTPTYKRKYYEVPNAPGMPMAPGGILRPGYYGRVSRPPPAILPAPSGVPGELCWTNRSKESCNGRPACIWDNDTGDCVSKRRGGRTASMRLGVPAGGFPSSVCATANTSNDCQNIQGCRWSKRENLCEVSRPEEFLNQPWGETVPETASQPRAWYRKYLPF
jgi:hypothetical protein